MQAVKAKATVAGRSYGVVFVASPTASIEGLSVWGARLISERHKVKVGPESVRIYER